MAHKLPIYPADHQVGMEVPKGGSSCSKCEYVKGQNCREEKFIEWNGGPRIPKSVDRYCCDFFEPSTPPSDRRSPHGFPSLNSLKREAKAEGESVAHEREEYKKGGS